MKVHFGLTSGVHNGMNKALYKVVLAKTEVELRKFMRETVLSGENDVQAATNNDSNNDGSDQLPPLSALVELETGEHAIGLWEGSSFV